MVQWLISSRSESITEVIPVLVLQYLKEICTEHAKALLHGCHGGGTQTVTKNKLGMTSVEAFFLYLPTMIPTQNNGRQKA